MRIFFSSDTHYFHENIIKYCERPFASVAVMNEFMINEWNSVVNDDDIAFHLGDLSLLRPVDSEPLSVIISRLNGKKILVKGNHDKDSNEFLIKSGFKRVCESLNLGKVFLFHYPLHGMNSEKLRDSTSREISHVVHGHIHTKDTPNLENHYNVSADRHAFKPVQMFDAIPQRLHEDFIAESRTLFNLT